MTEHQQFVFVVDDDQPSRDSVVALLEPMGVIVRSFASAKEFLDSYSGERPGCVVSDLRMPGFSGIQMIERLRQLDCDISVVIITAFPDTRSTVTAIKFGAATVLEKPCNPQELWDTIVQAIAFDETNLRSKLDRENAGKLIEKLTAVEVEVLEQISAGAANKIIAKRLCVSLRTVEGRRASILSKLNVRSNSDTWLWVR